MTSQDLKQKNLHENINLLSKEAYELSSEFESQCRLVPEFSKKIKNLGLFHMLVPENMNGLGYSLTDWLTVVRKLAASDASVGWCVAHGAITSAIISSVAGRDFRQRYFNRSDNSAAWSNLSDFEAILCEDGIKITGRWGFVTGCTHADYVGGVVKIPIETASDRPKVRSVLVPVSEATIVESWNPMGLAGSGSHDVVVDNLFVPSENIFRWPKPWLGDQGDNSNTAGHSNPTDALACGTWPISICCAATQIGIAEGALAELHKILNGKRDYYSGKNTIDRPHITISVEQAHSDLVVARNSIQYLLEQAWTSAVGSGDVNKQLRLEIRLASVNIVHRCRDIVRAVFDAAGASALAKNGRLERLYRDSSCLTSHVSVSKSSFETTSRVRYNADKSLWL